MIIPNHTITQNKIFRIFIITLVAGCCLISIKKAEAAVISLSPNSKQVTYEETFLVDVRLNSEQKVVNAVQATIQYPTTSLEVVDISRGGSFLTLWPQEPTYDNKTGIISFAGGIPNGSLVTDGKIITITFKAKTSSLVDVSFIKDSTSVHLNDGVGTAVPVQFVVGTYTVAPTALIAVTSPTHPQEDVWYSNNSPVLRWNVQTDAEYSYTISTDPNQKPDDHREIQIGEVSYHDLSDGVYYFLLKERVPNKDWVLVGTRRVMIDTQPPLLIQTSIGRDNSIQNNQYFLVFATNDVASGVDHYEVVEGTTKSNPAVSPFILKDQTLKQTLIVYAIDKAGNKVACVLRGQLVARKSSTTTLYCLGLALVFVVAILTIVWCSKRRHKKKSSP
jgi:hypothetical protein